MKIVQKLFLVSIAIISVFLAYIWVYPLVKKCTEKGKLQSCVDLLEDIGNMILYVALTGNEYEMEIYVPGELRIRDGFIELLVKGYIPLVSQREFLPINSPYNPIEKKKIVLKSENVTNCSYVNCSWCKEYGCNSYDVFYGSFENETFAIFWIYDEYKAVCFTNDTIEDGFLEINENNCFFEGGKYKNYTIFLVDRGGNYVILEDGEEKRIVTEEENKVVVVARSIGYKEYLNEFRLYVLDFYDDFGNINRIYIVCRKNCWKGEGKRIIYAYLEKIEREGNEIRRFIRVEFK